jgi:hypothetical protein
MGPQKKDLRDPTCPAWAAGCHLLARAGEGQIWTEMGGHCKGPIPPHQRINFRFQMWRSFRIPREGEERFCASSHLVQTRALFSVTPFKGMWVSGSSTIFPYRPKWHLLDLLVRPSSSPWLPPLPHPPYLTYHQVCSTSLIHFDSAHSSKLLPLLSL